MSPWLCNIFIDGVVGEVNARVLERGAALMSGSGGEWQLHQILYADDIALVADEGCKLHRLVSEFGRVCERCKLSVNVAKSKVMRVTINENFGDIENTLNGIIMDKVDCFRYLGVDNDRVGGMKSEMKHRVTEGLKVSGVLKNIWKRAGISKDAKRSMHEGIVVPKLLDGSEVWAASAEDRKKMGVMEIKCMRAMCGVNIMCRIRNEEVRRRCGSELGQYGERMYRNVFRWYGHV
jgi:hypothetical protein